MKILALYDGGGTRYHRVKLPLSFFKDHQVFFSKDLNEDLIKEIDVLWIGWNHNVYPFYLSAWQSKYGFKIIVDIDDSWEIPKNHVSDLRKSIDLSKRYVSLADEVVVSNWRLIKSVSKLNPNVQLIENGIPYGWGQFQIKEESEKEFMNRRIKVGFFGGGKHYNDWAAIQGWIRTLVNNQLFKENADFYICGYNSKDPLWRKIASKFPEAKLIDGKPVENYIPVFDLDVCLVPLEDNYFNTCKTELRVLESVCPGALCLLDPIYRELGENYQFHIVCEKDKNFLTATLDLLRNKEQLWMLKRDAQTLTKHHEEVLKGGYIEKCVEPRLKLVEQREVFSDFQIWSIMYNEDQLYDFYPYINPIKTVEQLSYLFEYNPITKLIPKSKGKYVGVFSHKFGMKTGITRNRVIRILEQENVDVISFCKQIPTYLQWTEKQHPGFLWRFTKLCRELGLTCKEPRNVVYSNFFVAKSEVYQEYVRLLQKAIVCLSDESYKAFEPVKYLSGLSSEDLEKATGLKHYTWHTFLLERLMSVWIDNQKLTFKNYVE